MNQDVGRPEIGGRLVKPFTRREVLKGAAVVSLSMAAAPLLNACGSGSPAAVSSTAAGTPKQGGTLTVGVAGGSIKDTLDPYISEATIDHSRNLMLYDSLVRWDANYQPVNMLAEEITPSQNASVWTIRLREGVTFHNGKDLTADDVVFSFARMLDPKKPTYAGSSLASVDRKRIKKLDARTVEVGLKYPNSVFLDSLCEVRTLIVPTGFDPRKPVGSGPFAFKSFVAGDRCVLAANRDYWGEGPYADEYVTIDFPDDTARVNALLGGTVDAITEVPQTQASSVKAQGGIELLRQKTGRFDPFDVMVDRKPYSDVRVRQALRLVMDRSQMVELVLGGFGQIGNDVYGPFDPGYPTDLPQRQQDFDQAKSLLQQAGQAGLTVTLVVAPLTQGQIEVAQVFTEQAKGAGIKVETKRVEEGAFWNDYYGQSPFILEYYSVTRNYLAQTLMSTGPDAPWNVTHWKDSKWNALVAEAFKTIDDQQRNDLVREAATIEHESGGMSIYGFKDSVDAYSDKVGGVTAFKGGLPLGSFNMNRAWVK